MHTITRTLILLAAFFSCLLQVLPGQAAAPPAPVPQTGQTTSYAAGDDGATQRGVAWPSPRFTDNLVNGVSNGTVTDNLTGLVWLKDANCFGVQNWTSALSKANSLM